MVQDDLTKQIADGVIINKRTILIRTKSAYRSIACDLVKFLIRYRFENTR